MRTVNVLELAVYLSDRRSTCLALLNFFFIFNSFLSTEQNDDNFITESKKGRIPKIVYTISTASDRLRKYGRFVYIHLKLDPTKSW